MRPALLVGLVLASCRGAAAELVVANGPDPEVLDPQLASSTAEGRILSALTCGLTRLDPATLLPQPALAQSWRAHDGGRSWEFTLRPDLRWSDGSPLTAVDFVDSWRRLLHPATAAPCRDWLPLEGLAEWDPDGAAPPAGLQAEGGRLSVRFQRPVPCFDQMCAYHALAPLPPCDRAAPAGEPASLRVSSGPYRLLERRVRDRVRVARNPCYWDAASVTIARIDFLTTDSLLTALNLFLAGDADYAPDVPSLAIPALASRAEYAPAPYFGTEFYRVNCRRGPLQDARVRRALSLAVDRDALAATVGGGQAPARSFVPPYAAPYQPAAECRFDPQAAADLLAAAGFPGGSGLPRLRVVFPSGETSRDVAEALADQWRRHLGVATTLDMQESASARAAVRAGDYDLARASWIGDYLDPATFLDVLRADNPQNQTAWADPEYGARLAAAEGDAAARLERLRAAESYLLEQAPIIPLFHYATHELVAPRIANFARNSRQYVDWGRLRLAATGPED